VGNVQRTGADLTDSAEVTSGDFSGFRRPVTGERDRVIYEIVQAILFTTGATETFIFETPTLSGSSFGKF
jgi:hypothetical protein